MKLAKLLTWPLLIAAGWAMIGALEIIDESGSTGGAEALIVISAVLVGAWIVMLAIHGYDGESPDD